MELRGKTVLITRAASQSHALQDGLARLGAKVIECPAIQVTPVEDWTEVDRAIAKLNTYQWLLFTSANAVEHFLTRLEKVRGRSCSVPVAVVGPATARSLRDWNISPSLIPTDFRAEGLVAAFPSDLRGVRILFPRAQTARELLPEELRQRGATVDVVVVYRTVKAEGMPGVREILSRERVDCIVFTSPSAIRFMADSADGDLAALVKGIAIAVIGPVTREAAASFGITPTIEPAHATVPDLIDAIREKLL
jgi:uroporphyrinogen-III synthase